MQAAARASGTATVIFELPHEIVELAPRSRFARGTAYFAVEVLAPNIKARHRDRIMRAHRRKSAVRRETSGFARLVSARRAGVRRFILDESGSYAIIAAVAMPALVGAAGLGTEAAWWFYAQKNMLS